jgi:hypothetical protein
MQAGKKTRQENPRLRRAATGRFRVWRGLRRSGIMRVLLKAGVAQWPRNRFAMKRVVNSLQVSNLQAIRQAAR